MPPVPLPSSETEGAESLDLQGARWGNLPLPKPDYVSRCDIEEELKERLLDPEQDPIITLGGPGGIGKTSTALQVLYDLAAVGAFEYIFWFSARDIDRFPRVRRRQPKVLTFDEAAREFARLLHDQDVDATEAHQEFVSALSEKDPAERSLFVFDNFETMLQPGELFRTLKSYIRLPNKILITTRFNDFKGQYPVDVSGWPGTVQVCRHDAIGAYRGHPTEVPRVVRSLHSRAWDPIS